MIRAILALVPVALVGCAAPNTSPTLPASLRLDRTQEELPAEMPAGALESEADEESFEPEAGSHAIGIFAGGSGELGDLDGITVGVEYGLRLTDEFGLGLFVEEVSGLDRSVALGVHGFWVSPIDLVLFAGFGAERRHEEWGAILRLGIEYEIIHPTGWFLSPSIFYDTGEIDDLLLYGFTVGQFF